MMGLAWGSGACFPPNSVSMVTKNTGVRNKPNRVTPNMPENTAMLKLFKRLGFTPGPKREPQVVHLVLPLV